MDNSRILCPSIRYSVAQDCEFAEHPVEHQLMLRRRHLRQRTSQVSFYSICVVLLDIRSCASFYSILDLICPYIRYSVAQDREVAVHLVQHQLILRRRYLHQRMHPPYLRVLLFDTCPCIRYSVLCALLSDSRPYVSFYSVFSRPGA